MSDGRQPRVGPYEPLELLAVGGTARVVAAKRVGLAGFEKLVALELILPEYASDEAYVTMLLDEAPWPHGSSTPTSSPSSTWALPTQRTPRTPPNIGQRGEHHP